MKIKVYWLLLLIPLLAIEFLIINQVKPKPKTVTKTITGTTPTSKVVEGKINDIKNDSSLSKKEKVKKIKKVIKEDYKLPIDDFWD